MKKKNKLKMKYKLYIVLVIISVIICIGLFFNYADNQLLNFLKKWFGPLEKDCSTIGACVIASVLAFMTVLSIGISNQSDEYFGIKITQIYKCKNPYKSLDFKTEIIGLLWLCVLMFFETIFGCIILLIFTAIISYALCFILWFDEGSIIIRNDKKILEIVKDARLRSVDSLEFKFNNSNIDIIFVNYLLNHNCIDLVDENNKNDSIDHIVDLIFVGLNNLDNSNQFVNQFRTILKYISDNNIEKTALFKKNFIDYFNRVRKIEDGTLKYNLYFPMIDALVDYASDEKSVTAFYSIMLIIRYSSEYYDYYLLSALFDSFKKYRLNYANAEMIHFIVLIYFFFEIEGANLTLYDLKPHLTENQKKLLLSFINGASDEEGNHYTLDLSILRFFRISDESGFVLDRLSDTNISFFDEKHKTERLIDVNILTTIVYTYSIYFSNNFSFLGNIKKLSHNSSYYVTKYYQDFYEDFSTKKVSSKNLDLVRRFMKFYGIDTIVLEENEELLQKVNDKMSKLVNDDHKAFNEATLVNGNVIDVEKHQDDIALKISSLLDKELLPFKECCTKQPHKTETIPILINVRNTFTDIDSFSNFLFYGIVYDSIRKHVSDSCKDEPLLNILQNRTKLPFFLTNLFKYQFQDIPTEQRNLIIKKANFIHSGIFAKWFIIYKNNFFFNVKRIRISIRKFTDEEIEFFLENVKTSDGYMINDAEYSKNEAVQQVKKLYKRMDLYLDIDFCYNGLHISNKDIS